MADRRAMSRLSDDDLGAALTALGHDLAVPTPATGDDPARLARQRIEAAHRTRARRGRPWFALRGKPLRRSLVLALVALLVLAAVAAAIGFGVPGIRIVFAPGASASPSGAPTGTAPPTVRPAASPSASLGPAASLRPPAGGGTLGSSLGLGTPFAVEDAPAVAGIPLLLPPDPPYGPPASAWWLAGRVSLVWPAGQQLPTLREPGIGLVLAQFPGDIDPGFFSKILQPGTEISAVLVSERIGWWISGQPHELVFVAPNGEPVWDTHRIVGDVLMWSDGRTTFRLEAGLDREGAIELAESLR